MILQNLKEKEALLYICNAYEYQSLCNGSRIRLNRIKIADNLRYGRKKVYVIY